MLNAVCPAHNSPLIFLNLTSRKRICHNCAVSGTNINLAQIRKMFNTLIEEEKLPQEVLELLKPAIRELKKYLGCQNPKLVELIDELKRAIEKNPNQGLVKVWESQKDLCKLTTDYRKQKYQQIIAKKQVTQKILDLSELIKGSKKVTPSQNADSHLKESFFLLSDDQPQVIFTQFLNKQQQIIQNLKGRQADLQEVIKKCKILPFEVQQSTKIANQMILAQNSTIENLNSTITKLKQDKKDLLVQIASINQRSSINQQVLQTLSSTLKVVEEKNHKLELKIAHYENLKKEGPEEKAQSNKGSAWSWIYQKKVSQVELTQSKIQVRQIEENVIQQSQNMPMQVELAELRKRVEVLQNFKKKALESPSDTITKTKNQKAKLCQQLEQQLAKTKTELEIMKQQHEQARRDLQLNLILPGSLILTKNDEKLTLMEFFEKVGKKPISGHLVFRMNSFNVKQFHNECSEIENMLLIVKSSNGRVFGGFTSMGWSEKICEKKPWGFIFSLDRKEMLAVKEDRQPTHLDRAYGPIFGQGELRIGLDGTGYSVVGIYTGAYEADFKIEPDLQKTFMAGSPDFKVESYELYRLAFSQS